VAPLLAGGTDCVVASIGTLADRVTERALTEAAAQGGSRLILPAGAVGGLDLIAAARFGGLSRVTYQSRKPPGAWRGTPAEAVLDLSAVREPVRFFQGTARDAALAYPQNANVAAAVALAGLGFDATDVELWAVPDIAENRHAIDVQGAFGTARFEIAGRPLPGNPKTSYLAALSVLRAVTNAAARIVI
jgi:aspartate dehydrogenase